jgi:medium-chain acyl-[acyl-carrier-protein] hydrolase
MKTRKLAAPDWTPFQEFWRRDKALALLPEKIPLLEGGEELAEFKVRNSDLDLNNHVNNTRYAQWILDAVPVQSLKTATLHEYEINFLAETKLEDSISLQHFLLKSPADSSVQFQGFRKADAKTVFSAKLKVTEYP